MVWSDCRGFSLVEVTLAVAVVAIGLLGVLALFPLGMDAVRQAADSTQMMAIGQDWIAEFQQEAANASCYDVADPVQVIDPASPSFGSCSSNLNVDGIWYRVDAIVTNSGFPQITVYNNTNFFSGCSTIIIGFATNITCSVTNTIIVTNNMISRVRIGVYRIAGAAATSGITSTNYYFTEVARYVQ